MPIVAAPAGLQISRYPDALADLMSRLVVAPMATRYLVRFDGGAWGKQAEEAWQIHGGGVGREHDKMAQGRSRSGAPRATHYPVRSSES